ncbi:mucin-2-like [Heteronotia binoei]|uniref:mucin-2-like n=1 Tax=Heteronotia binoei TaxID=13085 RepID=UPI002930AAA6|nr:mucin-2-like [Heteronotia binoei]
MMGSSVKPQEMGPPERIFAPSGRVTRARRVVSCSAISSVCVVKRQRIVLAIVACLITGTVAQREGSSVAPYQTPQGAREVSSASLFSQSSKEARRTVEEGFQNPSIELQPDLLSLGRNLSARNLVADQVDPTVPVHIAGTSWDLSKASGLLSTSSPVDKNSSEVLALATSTMGSVLAKMNTSLNATSKGLRESTDVLQPVEKENTGLFSTISPTSPLLPDAGSSSRLDVTPTSQMALSYSSTVTPPNTASSIAPSTRNLTSVKPPASADSPQGAKDLPGTSQPLVNISHTTLLDLKSSSYRGDVLPSAETGFLTHRTVKEASVSPKRLGTSLSLPTRMVPSEATHVAMDVFHSSSTVTAHSFSESMLHVSTGISSASLSTQSPEATPRSITSLHEAALNGQGPGGTKPAARDALESTAVPTALPRSSTWPLSSYSQAHATLPDFVMRVASLETEGLATHSLSWHRLVPASAGSPKLNDATALSTLTGGAPGTVEKDTEVPLSRTSQMETSETHSGVGEGTVPLVHDLATVSAPAGKETLGHLSTLQNIPGSEATSGFPVSNASLPMSHAPRTDPASSSGAASQMEMGPTTHSPQSSPAVSPSVHFSLSTMPLELETVTADNATEAVLLAHGSTTSGEGSTRFGSTSWVNMPASLGTTEERDGFPTTRVHPSPSPGEGTSHEWKEGVSPTAESSADVPGRTSILDGQNESTSLEASSSFLPTDASSLPTFSTVHSRGVETGYALSSLHSQVSSSTIEALPSEGVTDFGSYREETQPELHDRTGPITAAAGKVPESISELSLVASSMVSSSSTTSAVPGVTPGWKHFAYSTERSKPMPSPLRTSTFLATSGTVTSKESSEPETLTVSLAADRASNISVPKSTTKSNLPDSTSELPLGTSEVAHSIDSSSSLTSATLGVPSAWKHFVLSTERTRSTPSLPPRSTFLTTFGMAASKKSSEPETPTVSSATEGASSVSVPPFTTVSNVPTMMSTATLPSQFENTAGVVQPFQTTFGGTQQAEMVMESPSTSPGRELFNRTRSQWRLSLPTFSQAAVNKTELMDTSRAVATSTGFFLHSSSYRSSSQRSASLSHVVTKSTIIPQTNTTQAVTSSFTAKDLLAHSRILSTTQAVTPSSTTTDLQTSSRILPITQAMSPLSSTTDLLASSRIFPTTQAVSPSSSSTDLQTSSRIFPTIQMVSPSSPATDQQTSSGILPTTQASSSATDQQTSSRILPTTQGVSSSSSITDLQTSSRILPTTQAVSSSSSAPDMQTSSRIFPTTQAVSLSSSTTDLLTSSRIFPATQTVSPSTYAPDLQTSSGIFPTSQVVSPSSSSTDLQTSSRIFPATQAVSPSSSAPDMQTSSGILPTTQAVSPSSSATDLQTSSRILPASQVSLSSSSTDLQTSSRIFPTTQAVSPSSSPTDLLTSSKIFPTTQTVSPSTSAPDLQTSSRIVPTSQVVSLSSSSTDLQTSSRIFPATQVVSLSSSRTDLLTSSRIFPTTQTVSPSSSAPGMQTSSGILPTTQAMSPSSSATDLQTSSKIFPTIQTVSPSSPATDLQTSSGILSTTQAVSPSSAIDLQTSSGILPTTQAVSPLSSSTDLQTSSGILPTTEAVSPSSSSTDLQTSSRILPTTQAVSPSSSSPDLQTSSGILPTTQAVSPSSSSKDLQTSSRILPTTQAMSPSSSSTDLQSHSGILPTTQAVSPSSSSTYLQTSSGILPSTQAVSSSSSSTYLQTSSGILPTTQTVSPSSSAPDLQTSSGILLTTQAVSLSFFSTDVQASSGILPATQTMSPSSSAQDLQTSSGILFTTQAVSPSSSTHLLASSKVLSTTQAVSLSSSGTNLLASSTTQAVSPSYSATELPASSRILPATQAVSPTSSPTDLLVSSSIQAVSPSSSATVPPASSRIVPTTQATFLQSSMTDPMDSFTTQAVSPSSSATDLSASSKILPTTQTAFSSSSTTDPLTSSRILPAASMLTTRASCSDAHCLNNTHPASFASLPRTSAQLPVTSQTLSPMVLVTTLGSTVGMEGTMGGSSSRVDTPKVTYTIALTGMKPGTIARDNSTSKHLVSATRASTVGQTAERDNITLSRRTLAVSILSLEFHLTRIDYTESLANKSSARYKKLEREVILTLNKMLSFYETFLRANVLRFLNGSVIAQTEAVFRGDGLVPTPSDMIRMIVTTVEQREMDAFFDWRVDLRSLRCNGFSLKNLDPEVLAVSFTVLGQGSFATFGGLTDWGPLERVRDEVVRSLDVRYRVQNFSLVQVRNVQGDLDVSGEICVNTAAHVDISWALEALKGLVNYSVDLGSICINGSRLSLQIFPVSFLVTNRIFSEKLLDRSSTAHQSLSWDLSKALMHTLGKYKNLLQVTIREVRGGSLICYGDMIFQPPAPTNKDLVLALSLSVGPKNYLGASGIQVDPFSFTVAGATLEPPFANSGIPGYGIALIVLSGLALIIIPFLVLLYKHLGWKEKMVIHRVRDPEVMVETFELDNPTFRPLTEDNNTQTSSPTEALG